ncbi:phage tail fiber protein [Nocardia sp. NPDC001965]
MAYQITATRNDQATYFGTKAVSIALCTGSPGTSGTIANEVTGGSYARKTPSWGSASAGTITAAELEFDVPSGTTVTHVAYLNNDGTVRDWVDSADISFTVTAGKLRVTPKHTVT